MERRGRIKGLGAIVVSLANAPWPSIGVLFLAVVGLLELDMLRMDVSRATLSAACIFAGTLAGAYPGFLGKQAARWETAVALFFTALLGLLGPALVSVPLVLAVGLYDRWKLASHEHLLHWTSAGLFLLAWAAYLAIKGVDAPEAKGSE